MRLLFPDSTIALEVHNPVWLQLLPIYLLIMRTNALAQWRWEPQSINVCIECVAASHTHFGSV